MRNLRLCLAATCVLPLAVSVTNADNQGTPGKTYYKDGINLEYGNDFDMKLNLLLQPRYTFTDLDTSARKDDGVSDPGQDTSSFELERVRLIMTGNFLNDQFSYKVQDDLHENGGSGDFKDGWLQWNGEMTNVRFGQFKVPFTRQELVSDSHLFFPERSIANDFFSEERDTGAMAHGMLGDMGHYYLGIFNGNSDGEGRNLPGVDNKHNGAAAIDFSTPGYGSRGEEGDMRGGKGDFGATGGVSFIYGQGEATFGDTFSNFDQIRLNADLGVRCSGADLQGEFYWQEVDPTDINGPNGKADNTGFYIQAMYNMDKLGFGGRFSYLKPDTDVQDLIDDEEEFSLGVNYYINGQALKLQNAVTWDRTSAQGGLSDITDFTYVLQLSGLI